jgi:hypothetical protein
MLPWILRFARIHSTSGMAHEKNEQKMKFYLA